MTDLLQVIVNQAIYFEREAHAILSRDETSKSRIISLDDTRRHLESLSLEQDILIKQALLCVEKGVYRAAHVMAWVAFVDFLEKMLLSIGLKRIKEVKPGWSKFKSYQELCESVPEYQLIEVVNELGLISKTEMKTIHGLLSKRNECAHPSSYHPDLNESIGYISELLNRIKALKEREVNSTRF
ncbi:hypothetical protein SDD30_11075 [Moorella naiadis]|uniref:hypothetical protein n=1 Tax=Moorella naiadis (nom. illeg.) TaxID=3093670 RepID=UPI003D9C8EA9